MLYFPSRLVIICHDLLVLRVGRELCTPEPMSRGDNYAVVIIYNLVAGDLPGVAAVIHTNVLKKVKLIIELSL